MLWKGMGWGCRLSHFKFKPISFFKQKRMALKVYSLKVLNKTTCNFLFLFRTSFTIWWFIVGEMNSSKKSQCIDSGMFVKLLSFFTNREVFVKYIAPSA